MIDKVIKLMKNHICDYKNESLLKAQHICFNENHIFATDTKVMLVVDNPFQDLPIEKGYIFNEKTKALGAIERNHNIYKYEDYVLFDEVISHFNYKLILIKEGIKIDNIDNSFYKNLLKLSSLNLHIDYIKYSSLIKQLDKLATVEDIRHNHKTVQFSGKIDDLNFKFVYLNALEYL